MEPSLVIFIVFDLNDHFDVLFFVNIKGQVRIVASMRVGRFSNDVAILSFDF